MENRPGSFYVDSSCIDCDTCRQIAPETFARSARSGQSYVALQPAMAAAKQRAELALVACPTASIGGDDKPGSAAAARAFPISIDDAVYYCGYASKDSYGASSYLVRRAVGNVLVDSPRAAGPLLERIAELGGVRLMFLSHRDDVADHRAFRRRFNCRRILHRDDASADTEDVELLWTGREPQALAADLLMIPVPGHTRGSAVLLHREYLFTGDHLWWSSERNALEASRSVCWYSWREQTASMERLLDYSFEWILPGHGRRYQAESVSRMRDEMEKLVRRMRRTAA